MITYIIIAIISYLIGSISFSVLISKRVAGFDLREKGSKNAGSTNMLRTVGKSAALITLICDVLKGIVAILIAFWIASIAADLNKYLLIQIAGLFVVIGHTYPIFFKFKGGKGVATSLGVILLMNWQIGLICLVFALILMILSRIVSLGSISAAILFPVLTMFIGTNYLIPQEHAMQYLIFSILLALFVIFNHRANIKRLVNGEEKQISFKKKIREEVEEIEEDDEEEEKEDKKIKKKNK